MHYQYSLYLCQIKKNYQSSYFQLKLSETLDNSDGKKPSKQYTKALKVLAKKIE